MYCVYLVFSTNIKLIEMSLWNFCGDHCSACLYWPCVHYSPWRNLARWWFYWICSPWTTYTYLLFFTWGG